jgi:micrococcal nuclease
MSSSHGEVPAFAKKLGHFFIAALIVAGFFEVQDFIFIPPLVPTTTQNTVGVYYDVTKVTDGDTIHVLMDGRDEVVRLIGINTPETVDPRRAVQCFGKEASTRMKELAQGKIVRLEYDETQDLRDAYNRILAYVYLEDGQMLNRKMVAEGYAYEYTYMKPYKYQPEFKELQILARTSSRGLWSQETCGGSKALSQ